MEAERENRQLALMNNAPPSKLLARGTVVRYNLKHVIAPATGEGSERRKGLVEAFFLAMAIVGILIYYFVGR